MKKILFALIALLGIVACEKEPATTAESIKLVVDNSEIYANGIQTATFRNKEVNQDLCHQQTYPKRMAHGGSLSREEISDHQERRNLRTS